MCDTVNMTKIVYRHVERKGGREEEKRDEKGMKKGERGKTMKKEEKQRKNVGIKGEDGVIKDEREEKVITNRKRR